MRRSGPASKWWIRLLRSEWGKFGLLLTAAGLSILAVTAVLPPWFTKTGDQSEFWISPDLEKYIGLAVTGFGIAWSVICAAFFALQARRTRS